MASVTMQRDLVVKLKRETYENVKILSKVQPMPADLSRQVFKENALEKLKQNTFNHLSYYLVSIIDPQVCETMSWPLYDTKTEKMYRGQLSTYINDSCSKFAVSPVMSSYLVNPGCYKVTKLIFQLSQLAVHRLLLSKMKTEQKELYNTMTDGFTNCSEGFIENIEKETHIILSKGSNYLHRKEANEKVIAIFHEKITSMEKKIFTGQKYIDDLVDKYVSQKNFDDSTKNELLKIKNVLKPAPIFDACLSYTDERINELELKWSEKMGPFLKICSDTRNSTEALIARHNIGEADRSSYTVEYNHKTDEICTKDLQSQVNTEQKYILMNIVRDEKLYFPNLIRGFLIAICYIMNDIEIGDDISKFNEYLESRRQDFGEVVSALRKLNDRVLKSEARLEPSPLQLDLPSINEYEIPPLPDLSNLKATREHPSLLFDTFTPISMSNHQFNLRRKHNSFSFSTKTNYQSNQPKSMFATPFHQGPPDDFLKSLISGHVSSYDRPDVSQNFHNLSVISQENAQGNETIAECSGFTKQQIMRLLFTKKSSSSNKMKHKRERPSINVKEGGLFNESTTSKESIGLFRSYSSPNLFENREKISIAKQEIMLEDIPSLLEVSGLAALEKDNTYGTPEGVANSENSRKLTNATSLPVIVITPAPETKIKKDNTYGTPEGVANLENSKKLTNAKSLPVIVITPAPETKIKKDNTYGTPEGVANSENSRKLNNATSLPVIVITPAPETKIKDVSTEKVIDFNKIIESDISDTQLELKEPKKSLETKVEGLKTETPKNNSQLIRKTSSLEKIINRFKKVRENVLPSDGSEEKTKFKAIVEEKENNNSVNVDVTANRILLPDLLSPSGSVLPIKSTEYLDQLCIKMDEEMQGKPRQSLGTAMGVDITFLDQFDLIDEHLSDD